MSAVRTLNCGSQHHFIGTCRFHLATFIDDIVVSTVGDYRRSNGDRDTVGLGRYYETYVFRTDGDWSPKSADGDVYGHPDIIDWVEFDGDGAQTAAEAAAMHSAFVDKYLARVGEAVK